MAAGVLAELHRWPVKSCAGEPLRSARLGPHGVGGDRAHFLTARHGERWIVLTARQAPRLLAWRAAYPQAPDDALDPTAPPLATLTAPDGRPYGWDDPALPAALERDLRRPVRLHRDPTGQPDLPGTVLVTVEATRRAIERALDRPLELRRFRPNLHLELDAPPYAEERWQGARLTLGALELELLHPCVRCVIPTRSPETQVKWPELMLWLHRERGERFGINARVVRGGRLAVGDPATLA